MYIKYADLYHGCIKSLRFWRGALTNSWLLLHRKFSKIQVYQRRFIKLWCRLARYASLAFLYRRLNEFKACKYTYIHITAYICCNASSHFVAVGAQFIGFPQQSPHVLCDALHYSAHTKSKNILPWPQPRLQQ